VAAQVAFLLKGRDLASCVKIYGELQKQSEGGQLQKKDGPVSTRTVKSWSSVHAGRGFFFRRGRGILDKRERGQEKKKRCIAAFWRIVRADRTELISGKTGGKRKEI